MSKTHVFELVSGQDDKPAATFWWDGKKVQCDDDYWLSVANRRAPKNLLSSDGIPFLEALGSAFGSGYTYLRSKPDEV